MKRLVAGIAVAAGVMALGGDFSIAWSADHQLVTSVSGIYEYNDNIRLNSNNELSDSIYTITPKLDYVRKGERLTMRADASAEFYDYQDYDEFDDIDQWYNGSLEYKPSERWQVAVDGYASDDNRPDRDIETTGLVLSNIERKRFGGGATSSYMFTELMSAGVNLSFNRENFDDSETSDRKDYHAVLFVARNLDAWLSRTTGRLNLGYSHYEFDRDYSLVSQGTLLGVPVAVTTDIGDHLDVDYYSLTAGTESALSELLTLEVSAGGRFSQSEREATVLRTYDPSIIISTPTENMDDDDSYGFVGTMNLAYRAERADYSLYFSHDLQPTSGRSGTANRTTVRLNGNWRLLEKLRGHLSFQWHQNKSDQDDATQDDIDTTTWNARCGLYWELNKYFVLSGHYAYTIYEDHDDDTTAYRNKALVQLTARHDWLE